VLPWLLSLLCACAAPGGAPGTSTTSTCPYGETIYVINHGMHIGLAMRWSDIVKQTPDLERHMTEGQYVEFGWGDEDFYRAPVGTLALALRALFRSRGAVLYVVSLPHEPGEYYRASEVVEIRVAPEGYRRMLEYVAKSFATDSGGNLLDMDSGPPGRSRFYRARGNYSATNTCNTWVANALKAAGVSIADPDPVISEDVMASLRKRGGSSPACPPQPARG
jgi:uncharacterized protein (TIGR02117 family)